MRRVLMTYIEIKGLASSKRQNIGEKWNSDLWHDSEKYCSQ